MRANALAFDGRGTLSVNACTSLLVLDFSSIVPRSRYAFVRDIHNMHYSISRYFRRYIFLTGREACIAYIAYFATSFSGNNIFSVHLNGLFRHILIIRVSAHVRSFCNSGKSEVQSRPEKRAARICGNIQEIHDIAQYEWKLWRRFSNITTVIAFTFWIMLFPWLRTRGLSQSSCEI